MDIAGFALRRKRFVADSSNYSQSDPGGESSRRVPVASLFQPHEFSGCAHALE